MDCAALYKGSQNRAYTCMSNYNYYVPMKQ